MLLEELKIIKWILPFGKDLEADFSEYKKKEHSKWKSRAHNIGARFPIFDTLETFTEAIQNGRVFTLSESDWSDINNLTRIRNLEDLKSLVSSYIRPRDVDRIVQGIKNGSSLPLPIILKGNKDRWIMTGNTRLNVANIMKVPAKAIELDVSSSE